MAWKLAASHTNYKFYIYTEVTEADYANNRSKVKISFTIAETYGGSSDPAPYMWIRAIANGKYITGTKDNGVKVKCNALRETTNEQTMYSYSVWAPHDNNGNCSLTIKAHVETDTSWIWMFNGEATFSIPSIPRTSGVSINKSNVYVGDPIQISIDRKVSSFTHEIYYGMRTQSYYEIASKVGTTYTFTIPSAAVDYISGKSDTGYIKVITYNGSQKIGEKVVTFTVTIPATKVSGPAAIDAGETAALSMPSVNASLKHTVWWKMADMKDYSVLARQSTSQSFSFPVAFDLMSHFPKSTTGAMTIYTETYNGSTMVGSSSTTITIKAPASAVPKINSVSIKEAVYEVDNAFNQFVKSLSQLNVKIDAAGVYGSTITDYSTVIDGVDYISSMFTSNNLRTAGTMKITTTVTDSRGRKGTFTQTIMVADYFGPQLDDVGFYYGSDIGAPTPGGPMMWVSVAGRTAPVNNANKFLLEVKYRRLVDTEYTIHHKRDWSINGHYGCDTAFKFPELRKDESYEFVVTLSDKLSSAEKKLENGVTTISFLAGGKGICFFGEAEHEGIWLGDQKLYDLPTPVKL